MGVRHGRTPLQFERWSGLKADWIRALHHEERSVAAATACAT